MQFFFPSSGRVNTTVWAQHMDADEAYGEKIDNNCTRMLWAVLNKSWRCHPTSQQLYGYLPRILKTTQIIYSGHYWRRKNELISDLLQWTPSYRRASVVWPAKTYQQQFYTDTGGRMEDLPRARDNRDEWRERFREICDSGTPW